MSQGPAYKKNLRDFYIRSAVRWKPMKAAIQATAIVYMQMPIAQLHLPVSFLMATNVAMQGK